MTKENLEKRVEGLYDKKKLGKSLLARKAAGVVGSGIGAKIGENMAGGGLLGVLGGATVVSYVTSWLVGAPYWLYLNKDYYKGAKGKREWIADEFKWAIRRTPIAALQNLVYYPSLALFYKVLGLGAVVSGMSASLLATAVYVLGAIKSGKGLFSRKKRIENVPEKVDNKYPQKESKEVGMDQKEGYDKG